MIEFIKSAFYHMWRVDLIIFLVLFIGILLLFLAAWIKGIINKNKKNEDDLKETKNP